MLRLEIERDEFHFDAGEKEPEIDLMWFWKDNKRNLPTWYQVAMMTLPIQPSLAFME